ncbi:hypothetical protein E2C01_041747 [Portunus trituberculatus]|uniref:Uncharacterized protein n=1 Tax=Portunus trituberculatus TaxID=210409 RepID=A0A5B7FR71_PORTR|nr:hypothetical protein [Portunus trituberculatus]
MRGMVMVMAAWRAAPLSRRKRGSHLMQCDGRCSPQGARLQPSPTLAAFAFLALPCLPCLNALLCCQPVGTHY